MREALPVTSGQTQPRLQLVDATLELVSAAIEGQATLGKLLEVSVAEGWEGFPEALPVIRQSYEKAPQPHQWGTLFFVEPSARVLVGFGGFKGPPSAEAVVEVGYAIAPAFQRQGLATDAVAQMVARAFADPLIKAVDAHTLGEPNASTRVLEKSGFERIAEFVDPNDGAIWQWRRLRP